jgi:hypothetical protein
VQLRSTTPYLTGLVVGSVLVAAVETLAYWREVEPASPLVSAWPLVFFVLLVLWVVEDSKTHPNIDKPFEFGFLVFIWVIPYLPYYLWRTRRLKGLLLLAGFVVLYLLGYLGQLAVYAAG